MSGPKQLFTEHPASVGETWWQHLGSAWYFSAQMAMGAVCCLIHGLFPFLFEKSGSRRIEHLHDRMIVNRSRLAKSSTNYPGDSRSENVRDLDESGSRAWQ